MGLKHRKMQATLEEKHNKFSADINADLGTNFDFSYNGDIIPENADSWNLSDEKIAQSYYNTFFAPLSRSLKTLFEDNMYKEEINKQIKSVSFAPKDAMHLESDFSDGLLTLTISISVNQVEVSESWIEKTVGTITETIGSKLQ